MRQVKLTDGRKSVSMQEAPRSTGFFHVLVATVLALLVTTAHGEVFAIYQDSTQRVTLMSDMCPIDKMHELKFAIRRTSAGVEEGCYAVNERKNPVIRWKYEIEEIDSAKFVVVDSNKATTAVTNVSKNKEATEDTLNDCKMLYQSWVFNTLLEEACSLRGGVAAMLGTAAKTACMKAGKTPRDEWTKQVASDVGTDIKTIGRARFCQTNHKRYEDLKLSQ